MLLGRNVKTNLDSISKSRDITLPAKVHLVKAMVFPVVIYGCESWTIKKAEHRRTDAFELWCWGRLLRVPWTARRSSQSILREISPEYSLKGEGSGTPLQYFCLEKPMDGGAWWAAVHGFPKSRTRLSDITFTFHFHALEKGMAALSSVLAWRIQGRGSLVGCRQGVAQTRLK